MTMPSPSVARPTTIFELEVLESLPCGCVAAAYRAHPWNVSVVTLEAKGPYCIFPGHSLETILQVRESDDIGHDTDR